ncbi:MAG TPA: ABC transporter ATP-binding protein [Erysipelotrichaceae bacterium]|nr:ABC transporter ATP-binding protein [Erysipelotrichaceae bacterium]
MKNRKFGTHTEMVFYFLRGSKRYFIAAVIFAALLSLLDLINPKIVGFTVDSILGDKPSSLPAFINTWIDGIGGTAVLKENLWMIALAIVVVALLTAVCRFSFRVCNSMGAETFVQTMRNDLFGHIMRLPFKWHSENRTGDIIQRCTSDVEQIKMFVSEQLTSLFRVVVLIVLSVVFMLNISVKLTIVSGVFIPLIIGYSFYFHKKIGGQFRIVDEEEGKLSSIAQENLTGVRVVRAFGRETYERSRFEKQNHFYTNMWIRLMQLMAAFWSVGDLFSYGQVIAVMVYGVMLCVRGEITAGDYIAFVQYNNMIRWPIRMLGRVISNLSKAGISIDRLMYIMNSDMEEDGENALKPDLKRDITFDNVSYTYENGTHEILSDISFTIKAGSTVGILGGTGSGKSTLMYLLDRLYDLPEENGRIMIGDTDIRDISREYLRENIGMVLQEPYLFSRSLYENIRIAAREKGIDEVREAARIASLEDAIEHFKEGYETFVGERGVTLSGGQKQRTAIAQMLIRKPPIMIFDDSLSAVDAETDAKIRAALKENVGESTVILIGHRITTLMNADQIIVMDKGRITESGTHDELLKNQGIYRQIYDLQMQQSEEVTA